MGFISQSLVSPSIVSLLLALLGEKFGTWFESHPLFPLHQATLLITGSYRPETASGWQGCKATRGCNSAGKRELK